MVSSIILYNDGTHGDVTAGDAIWSNDNSVPAQPTYTIPLGATNSSGWTLRVFAKDASNSTIGAQNGLAHRNGLPAPEIEANFWNIDEINFSVAEADITITKISSVLNDPINGTSNPKAIPGAVIQYCILISNAGNATATQIIATDAIPNNVSFVTGSMASGSNCSNTPTVEDDNAMGPDESDPLGASISGVSLIATANSLAPSTAFALTFQVTVD